MYWGGDGVEVNIGFGTILGFRHSLGAGVGVELTLCGNGNFCNDKSVSRAFLHFAFIVSY